MDRANSICWDKPRVATSIKFNDEGANNQIKTDTNFTRHDTPHPRDLKARHQKLLQERQKSEESERSGSMSSSSAIAGGSTSGSNAVTSTTAVVNGGGDQKPKPAKPQPPPRTFPRPIPTATPNSDTTSETDSVIVRSDTEVNRSQKMLSQRIAEEALVNRSHLRDSLRRSQEKDQSNPSTQVITDRVKQIKIGNGVANKVEVVNVPSSYSDEEDENDEEGQTTAIFNDKHVGFIDDEGNEAVGDVQQESNDEIQERHDKLHRRDTPHHLKNKRINSSNSKFDQEKVASIISSSGTSNSNVMTQNLPNNPEPFQLETNHSRHNSSNHSGGDTESLRSSCLSSVSKGTTEKLLEGPVELKEIKIEVVKMASGLGLSIAGGKESTLYKGKEGIFVSRVTEGGAAHAAGLRVDDKIISVNNVSLEDVKHYEAVFILKSSGDRFVVVVKREVPIQSKTKVTTYMYNPKVYSSSKN